MIEKERGPGFLDPDRGRKVVVCHSVAASIYAAMCEKMSSALGAFSSRGVSFRFGRVLLTTTQDRVHLRQDLSRVRSGCNAKNLVLLQIVCAEVAQPILNVRRKPIQLLVLVHVKTWKQIHEVKDIGHQRSMES